MFIYYYFQSVLSLVMSCFFFFFLIRIVQVIRHYSVGIWRITLKCVYNIFYIYIHTYCTNHNDSRSINIFVRFKMFNFFRIVRYYNNIVFLMFLDIKSFLLNTYLKNKNVSIRLLKIFRRKFVFYFLHYFLINTLSIQIPNHTAPVYAQTRLFIWIIITTTVKL